MAEYGGRTNPDALAPSGIGHIMPAFIVYESARFDTKSEARKYVNRRIKEGQK